MLWRCPAWEQPVEMGGYHWGGLRVRLLSGRCEYVSLTEEKISHTVDTTTTMRIGADHRPLYQSSTAGSRGHRLYKFSWLTECLQRALTSRPRPGSQSAARRGSKSRRSGGCGSST